MTLTKVGKIKVEFKPLRKLEDCRIIRQGEMIGVGQYITTTIPARCINNDGKIIELIGNIDNNVMVKYTFEINKIEGFYDDGSIRIQRGYLKNSEIREFIEKNDERFNEYKRIWENSKK